MNWDALFTRAEQMNYLIDMCVERFGLQRFRFSWSQTHLGLRLHGHDGEAPDRKLSARNPMEMADLILPCQGQA